MTDIITGKRDIEAYEMRDICSVAGCNTLLTELWELEARMCSEHIQQADRQALEDGRHPDDRCGKFRVSKERR